MTLKSAFNRISYTLFAIVMFTFVLTLAFLFLSETKKNTEAEDSYYDEIKEVISGDDYNGITLSVADIEEKGLYQTAAENQMYIAEEAETESICDYDGAVETLQNLGYTVHKDGDEITAFTKFCTKRLIVCGDYSNTYGATRVVDGKNFDVLCYSSEDDASAAYESLNKSGANVQISSLKFADEVEVNETSPLQGTNAKDYTWGYTSTGIEKYKKSSEGYTTSENVVVVVIDTGVNTTHEILTDRFLYDSNGEIVGKSFITDTSTDDTSSNRYSASSYDFEDDNNHGTHVSGIIRQMTPSNVKIIPLKVLNADGVGDDAGIYSAIEYVIEELSNKYTIACVNMSLGGGYSDEEYAKYFATDYETTNGYFKQLREKNILPVVAAGNDSANTSTYLPAACADAITVSALDYELSVSGIEFIFEYRYSNYGDAIDIAAPGTLIYSSIKGGTDKYVYMSGTSMAAPHVAGVIALLCLDNYYWSGSTPHFTAQEIEEDLKSNVDPIKDDFLARYFGAGMLSLDNYTPKGTSDVIFTLKDINATYGDTVDLSNVSYTLTLRDDVTDWDTAKDKISLTFTTTATNTSDVGEYELTATVENDTDYSVSIIPAKYIISARPITLTLNDQSSIYGDEITLDNTQYNINSGQEVNDGDLKLVLSTTATSDSAGTYKIDIESYNKNYDITYEPSTYTVEHREIKLKLIDEKGIYGDDVVLNNNLYTITDGSLVAGDDLGITLTTTATSTSDVGKYKINVLEEGYNTNYAITYVPSNYIVTKRIVDVTLENQQTTYGTNFAFDNTKYTLDKNVVAGDDLEITLLTSATKDSDVGDYPIYLTYKNGNYVVEYDVATLKILPQDLTVQILDQTLTNSKNVQISQTMYTVTAGGESGMKVDGISIVTDTKEFENGGTYTLTGTNSNKNYNITFVNGTLTINEPTVSETETGTQTETGTTTETGTQTDGTSSEDNKEYVDSGTQTDDVSEEKTPDAQTPEEQTPPSDSKEEQTAPTQPETVAPETTQPSTANETNTSGNESDVTQNTTEPNTEEAANTPEIDSILEDDGNGTFTIVPFVLIGVACVVAVSIGIIIQARGSKIKKNKRK